jgi:hypothetical protein
LLYGGGSPFQPDPVASARRVPVWRQPCASVRLVAKVTDSVAFFRGFGAERGRFAPEISKISDRRRHFSKSSRFRERLIPGARDFEGRVRASTFVNS